MSQLLSDLAAVITDLDRMTFDLDDPLRHAKRATRNAALASLTDAVERAKALVFVVRDMEDAAAEIKGPTA